MSSNFFTRVDMSQLAAALVREKTHEGISTFERPLGLATTGNKADRASEIVRWIFDQDDTDALLIRLLNYLYVENMYADLESSEGYAELESRVLKRRGVTLTENGFALPDGRDVDSLPALPRSPAEIAEASFEFPFAEAVAEAPQSAPAASSRDSTKVFIVHGRDMAPVAVVTQFLQHLGLHSLTWSEAVQLTGRPQPHTYDVVLAGMNGTAATIVLFSPDDLARVKDQFSSAGDPDRRPSGQARQNVLLEAGMAFGMQPDRTIFVKSAPTREISDIAGFNWVKLDGRWDSRNDLRTRLVAARAAVRPGNYDLAAPSAGPFQVV